MDHPQNPIATGTFQPNQSSTSSWNGFSSLPRTPASVWSSNNTYLLPSSPSKKPKMSNESYKPKIARTCGQRPACLVNASVTYCGNNQIYAFGGFDQYTDEGSSRIQVPILHFNLITKNLWFSLQSCSQVRPWIASVESDRQLWRYPGCANG